MQPDDESRTYLRRALRHVAVEAGRHCRRRNREDGSEPELSGGRAGYARVRAHGFGLERDRASRLMVSRGLRRSDVESAEIRGPRGSEAGLECRGRNPHDGGGRGLLRFERARRHADTIDRLVIEDLESYGFFRPRRFFCLTSITLWSTTTSRCRLPTRCRV